MKRSVLKLIAVVAFLNVMFLSNANAQLEKYQSAFIYNISRYVEWPSGYNPDKFVIGVLGSGSSIASELNSLAKSKQIFGKPIVVEEYGSTGVIGSCNVLFVPKSQMKNLSGANAATQSKNVLIITEQKGAISGGSGINFLFANNKLQFELHKGNITSHGLKVNSALESLAVKTY